MNTEILEKSFALFQSDGYNGSLQDFTSLINENPSALITAHRLYNKSGDQIGLEEYKQALQGEPPVKKKEQPGPGPKKSDGVSKPEDGSLVSPKPKPSALSYEGIAESIAPEQASPLAPSPDFRQPQQKKFYEPQPVLSDISQRVMKPTRFDIQKPTGETPTNLDVTLSRMTSNIIGKEEEEVLPQMIYALGDYGFKFEKAGIMDAMNVTAPNGEKIQIDLDPIMRGTEVSEFKKLKKFVRENGPQGAELSKIESGFNQYNRKFYSEDEVKNTVATLNTESNALNKDIETYLKDKARIEDDVKIINQTPKDKRFTPEYNNALADLNVRMKDVNSRQETLKKRVLDIQAGQASLEKSVGKYAEMLSDVEAGKGNWLGAIWNVALEGVGRISAGAGSLVVDAVGFLAQGEGEQMYSGQQIIDAAKRLGLNPPDIFVNEWNQDEVVEFVKSLSKEDRERVDDLATDLWKKSIKYGDPNDPRQIPMLDFLRTFYTEQVPLADPTTTKEYVDLKKRSSFLGQAVLGVAESVPAFLTPGGWAMRTAALYNQTSDHLMEEMANNPEFANVTEGEKFLVTAPISIATAVLEAYGFRNAISQKGLLNNIVLSALGKSGAKTTAVTFKELVENEVESRIARGLLTMGAAGLAEAETGAAQQGVEFLAKDIYNLAKDKEMFNTPDSWDGYLKDILYSGALEAVGGLILGMPNAVATAYNDNNFNGLTDTHMAFFSQFVNDDQVKKAIIVDTKNKVLRGDMTLEQGKKMLADYDAAGGLLNSMPDDINNAGRRKALSLLLERRGIESSIQGKEEALIKRQKERISEINSELEKISKDYAIQEQATDEGVLRQEGPEVELQKMVEGDQVAQVATTQAQEEIDSKRKEEIANEVEVLNVQDVRRPDGSIGTQGFDPIQMKDLVKFISDKLNLAIPNNLLDKTSESIKPLIDYISANEDVKNKIIDYVKENPSEISRMPDGTIQFKDGNHRANLLNIIGSEVIPVIEQTKANEINAKYDAELAALPTTETGAAVQPAAEVAQGQVVAPAVQEGAVEAVAPAAEPAAPVRGVVSISDATQTEDLSTRVKDPLQKRVLDSAKRAINTIKSIFPDFDIVVHENEDTYIAEMGRIGGNVNSRGTFDFETKKIYINLKKSDATTVAHEVAHGVLLRAFGTNPALFKQFRDRMSKILSEDSNKKLNEFASQYSEEESHEEYLVELVGMLAEQQGKIAPTTMQKIAALINNIVSRITGGAISPLSEQATTKELIDFLNGMANAIRTGQEIGIDFESATDEQITRSQITTDGTGIKIKGNEPIKKGNTISTIRMENGRELSDYSFDNIMETTQSPNSRVVTMATDISSGEITYKNKDGVSKTFPLPYIDKKANSNLRRLKNKYKSIAGTGAESKARKQKIVGAINDIAKKVISDFTNTMSQNILAMYDSLSDSFVDTSRRWYEGANRVAQFMGKTYGKTTEQSAAIIAALSPKNDWFNNVSCAERVMDIMSKYSDLKLNKDILDKAIAYNKKTGKEEGDFVKTLRQLFNLYGEVSINDLESMQATAKGKNTLETQAILLRAIDHAMNSPKVPRLNSDGKVIGFEKAPIRWASSGMISRSISVFRDGSPENISLNMGYGNKVRNFYNNIADPKSETPYLTADTHAMSAALNSPISSEDAQGIKLFEGQMEPMYAIVKQAYIDAADVVGVQPREMQSVTWEGVRETINQKDRTATEKEESFNDIINSRENKQTPYERAAEHISKRSDRLRQNKGFSGNAKGKAKQRVSALSALRGRLEGGPVRAAEAGVDRRVAGRGADGTAVRAKPKSQILGESGAARLTNAEKSIVDLAVAKEMEKTGKDIAAIRMATGWERGADGQWRFEIPDGKLKTIDLATLPVDEEGRSYTTLGEIYDNEELYKAYDQEVESMRFIDDKNKTEFVTAFIPVDRKFKKLRDTRVIFDPRLKRGEGSYNGRENRISLSPFSVPNPRSTTYTMREQEMDFMPTLVHEIQHSVQDREFFEQGANSTTAVEYAAMKAVLLDQIANDRQQLYDEESAKEQTTSRKQMLDDLKVRIDDARRRSDTFMGQVGQLGQFELYQKVAGEVEARNAAERTKLSEAERRRFTLKTTEDVTREDQIILNDAFLGTPERAAESRVKPKSQKTGEGKPEGYDRMMQEVSGIIDKSQKRGVPFNKIMDNVLEYVKKSKAYEDATDTQREALIREVREMFGKKEKAAPSTNRILGNLRNINKITANETTLLKKQIKDLARGARDAKNAWRKANAQLAAEVKDLVTSGKITVRQASAIINRFASVNMFNPASIDKFVDYMTKVMENAEYFENISDARSKIPRAKNNLRKLGIAEGLMPALQRMLSVDPTYIPESVFGKYRLLLDMLSKRDAVLQLEEINKVKQDVNDVLDALSQQESMAYEFKDVFDAYQDKELNDDGSVNFTETINKMVEDGSIDAKTGKLMKKYESIINPKEETIEEETPEDLDQLRDAVRSTPIDDSLISTRFERDLVARLKRLVNTNAVNTLSKTELNNLLRVIDNINNGYVPHMAQLMVERLEANNNGDIVQRALSRAKLLPLSKAYAKMKSAVLRKKDAILTMIERNPFFVIDQVLGDFKTKEVFNAVFQRIAAASSKYESEVMKIHERLKKAENKIFKSKGFNHNKTMMSKFKIMTYLLELEYQSNPNSKKVSRASEFLKKTIDLIESGESQLPEREAAMLQDIINRYQDPDGNIDIDRIYDSFNEAEKEAIGVIQQINKENTDKAIYTQVVIRGESMDVIDNYVHHNVVSQGRPDEDITGLDGIRNINRSMMPSTRGKSLISRIPGAKAINFDPFQATQRGADYVLLDYYMTEPIRVMRKALNFAKAKMKENNEPKDKMKILNAISKGVEQTIHNTLANHYMASSLAMDALSYIKKTGYRAILASVPRFVSELTSNLSYALIANPKAFSVGVSSGMRGLAMSSVGADVMKNVGSVQVTRLYPSDLLSGRMIDTSIMQDAMGKNSRTKNYIANKMTQINSLTLKPVRSGIEVVADAIISTPDKMISRPIWFGSFANEFKSLTGRMPDFDLIAENNEAYMNENADAIAAAKQKADVNSIQAGASDNPFVGILKGSISPDQDAVVRGFNMFNNFMTRFLIYEYTTARTGVMAMVGRGSISKQDGAALLGAVTTRMVLYSFLTSTLSNGIAGLFVDEEEEDEKTWLQKFGQSMMSAGTSIVIGRDFGNTTKSVLNYGIERVNENYFDFLREGEYDPYKDMIQYDPFPKGGEGKTVGIEDYVIAMSGPFSPMLKSADLTVRTMTSPPKKEADAIERLDRNMYQRIPLEWAGHFGLVPIYKDIRNILIKDINKTIKKKGDKEETNEVGKRALKKYYPDQYEKLYGKKSEKDDDDYTGVMGQKKQSLNKTEKSNVGVMSQPKSSANKEDKKYMGVMSED